MRDKGSPVINRDRDGDNSPLDDALEEITQKIWSLAQECEGNSQQLLALLRLLEYLHRKVRAELFEPSLPDSRRAFYHLLREIEEKGGWPYIERMKLQTVLEYLSQETEISPESEGGVERKTDA